MISSKTKTRKCKKCNAEVSLEVYKEHSYTCPKCGALLQTSAQERLEQIVDAGTFVEWDEDIERINPLNDEEYQQKLEESARKSNAKEAVLTGEAEISGLRVALGIMEPNFMMASMGYYVGERICRLFERATEKRLPVVVFCCSGGARIQEGAISLMQMEKSSAAVKKHSKAGLLYISVLTNPTMGGVMASFAALGDIVLAEKGARIGFAGPRVIQQNLKIDLPEGFQTAEYALQHGFIDMVVERAELRDQLWMLLHFHESTEYQFGGLFERYPMTNVTDHNLTQWQSVRLARKKNRPTSEEFIQRIFRNFTELHGDRAVGDDKAIVGGLAMIANCPVTVIGQQKGKKSIQDAIDHNWGMPSPMGYRKAIRLVEQAEKFHRPVIFFVDTIGASCNIDAEDFGQGNVIADLLGKLSGTRVPVLSIVIGEGNSGGALAMAVANEVWMLENAVYSVLSPEAYASIIYKDQKKAEQAANGMRMKATDMYALGVVDMVFTEPDTLTVDSMSNLCETLQTQILCFIDKYLPISAEELIEQRYQRFRRF